MLRSLLVGVLALSTASACKGTSDAPAVQPGASVGKVVELSGDVSATRGTAKRPLASGQEISGDDTIETGAQGHVRIVLAHNNATWELGPNKKQVVSESMAWKLAKQDSPAGTVDEATLAAGRHAERETVTTTHTAPAPTQAPTDPAPASGGAPEPDMKSKGSEPARKQAPKSITSPEKDAKRKDDGAMERAPSKAATRSTEAPTAPMADPPPPPPPSPPSESSVDVGTLIKKRIAEERATLVACMETPTLAVEVSVTQGATTFVLPAGTPATVKQCFEQAAKKIQFPASYTLRVKTPLTK